VLSFSDTSGERERALSVKDVIEILQHGVKTMQKGHQDIGRCEDWQATAQDVRCWSKKNRRRTAVDGGRRSKRRRNNNEPQN
jgi:hypothetical protein